MPSPFPGMDPYLEASGYWEDFHDSFLTYFRDVLRDSLPSEYSVMIQERVTSISLPDRERKQAVLDVGVTTPETYRPGGGVATAPATAREPVVLEHDLEESATETYLEIIRRPEQKLITVIELLSPSNKETPGAPVYRSKRAALLNQYVHLVEIDLLIQGSRLGMRGVLPAGDYYAYVSRAEARPNGTVYSWGIRESLPPVPIPLLAPDPDYVLDLAALFRYAYDRGRYAREINYAAGPPPFLRPEEREWAREVVRQAQSSAAS